MYSTGLFATSAAMAMSWSMSCAVMDVFGFALFPSIDFRVQEVFQ